MEYVEYDVCLLLVFLYVFNDFNSEWFRWFFVLRFAFFGLFMFLFLFLLVF